MKKIQITKYKGSHGLHQDSFKLQIMTALIKSFCGCFRGGGGFFTPNPPPAPPEVRNDRFKKLAMAAAKGLVGDQDHRYAYGW
jgi:hypothetical protein